MKYSKQKQSGSPGLAGDWEYRFHDPRDLQREAARRGRLPSLSALTISENSRNSHNFLRGCNLCLLYGPFLMSRNLLVRSSPRRCSLRAGLKRPRPFLNLFFFFHSRWKLSRSAARRSHYTENNESPRNSDQPCTFPPPSPVPRRPRGPRQRRETSKISNVCVAAWNNLTRWCICLISAGKDP